MATDSNGHSDDPNRMSKEKCAKEFIQHVGNNSCWQTYEIGSDVRKKANIWTNVQNGVSKMWEKTGQPFCFFFAKICVHIREEAIDILVLEKRFQGKSFHPGKWRTHSSESFFFFHWPPPLTTSRWCRFGTEQAGIWSESDLGTAVESGANPAINWSRSVFFRRFSSVQGIQTKQNVGWVQVRKRVEFSFSVCQLQTKQVCEEQIKISSKTKKFHFRVRMLNPTEFHVLASIRFQCLLRLFLFFLLFNWKTLISKNFLFFPDDHWLHVCHFFTFFGLPNCQLNIF